MSVSRRFIYTHRAVRRQGRIDGRSWRWTLKFPFREPKEPQPGLDRSEHSQFERNLREAAESDVAALTSQWRELDVKLKTAFCQASAELRAAEAAVAKERNEATAAKQEYDAAREAFLALDPPSLSPRWMLFWLTVIAATEFPLNGLIFQVFGAGKLETYIMASGLALIIPLFAHWCGATLRKTEKTLTQKLLVASGPVVLLALLTAIGVLRGKYFAAAASALAALGIDLNPNQATVLFVILNFALFFVAMLISFEGSHPDKGRFTRCHKRLREAATALSKEAGEADAAAKRLDNANETYQAARTERSKRFEHYSQQAVETKQNAEWYMSLYRTSNMQARAQAAEPPCFKLDPLSVALPAHFALAADEIDWDCPEAKEIRG